MARVVELLLKKALHVQMLYLNKVFKAVKLSDESSTCTNVVFKSLDELKEETYLARSTCTNVVFKFNKFIYFICLYLRSTCTNVVFK